MLNIEFDNCVLFVTSLPPAHAAGSNLLTAMQWATMTFEKIEGLTGFTKRPKSKPFVPCMRCSCPMATRLGTGQDYRLVEFYECPYCKWRSQ